jgi:hypothetical protein
MPNPTEQSKDEFHEGTAMLQDIAADVEAERAQAGHNLTVPNDATPEDNAETREDHQGDGDLDVPAAPAVPGHQAGGAIKP